MRRAVSWSSAFLACMMPCVSLAKEAAGATDQRVAAPADAKQIESIRRVGLDPDKILPLLDKPLYKFTEAEVDSYLKYLQASEPDLRRRIVHLARKNIGQPYELYLLGEMPFEPYDPQPLYCLGKSDCVVFSEHTYAMALGHDWPGFMAMLQRIRYRDGRIGVATRNHYTEADWNVSNRWLVHDITGELAGDKGVKFDERIDRASFLKNRYGLKVEIPVEEHHDIYIPYMDTTVVESQLQDGDFVNVVRGVTKKGGDENSETFGGSAFVGHVGLVVNGPDGDGTHDPLVGACGPRGADCRFHCPFEQRSGREDQGRQARSAGLQVPAAGSRSHGQLAEDRRRRCATRDVAAGRAAKF